MTRWRVLALMLALSGWMGQASAMNLREFRLLDDAKEPASDYAQYYLVGLLEGALEANSAAVRQGAKPLFCVNGRRLEPSMAQSLFRAELRRNSDVYEADMPAQLVMVNALASAYTC